MAQKDKTKEEFIEEIKLLQKRIAAFEMLDSEHKQQDIKRLATIVRDSNDAIIIQDIDGRITAWNRGAEQMYGYKEKEALGMNIERLTFPGKVAEQKEFTRRLVAGEEVVSFETQRITKDGRILDVWLTVTKIVENPTDSIISTGHNIIKPIGIALIERNITERKKAEDALRESEEKYRFLKDIPVVFLTAIIREGEIDSPDGFIGGHPFIAKPVSVKDLVRCIEKHINASSR